jgi:hypothetical protein
MNYTGMGKKCFPIPDYDWRFYSMTETITRSIPNINGVEGFNPADFTRELPNEDGSTSLYLDVKYRLLWFRLHRPNGKIDTEIIHVDDKSAVVCSRLYADKTDPPEQYVAKSTAQRFVSSEKFGDRFLETAETAALGRVLAASGYGTQFCGSTDLLSDVIADAPVDISMAFAADDASEVSNRILHETKNVMPTTPVPAMQDTKPAAPAPKKAMTLEEYLDTMSIDDAKNVVIDVGHYSGSTLGEVAIRKPSDLEWYVKFYAGRNLALKAGAIILLNAVNAKAS